MKESLFENFVESRHLSVPPQVKNPTFADVLHRDVYIPGKKGAETVNIGIGRGWHEASTVKKIRTYFNNTFLPELNMLFGTNRPISTLSEQDYNRLLDSLGKKRQRNADTRARDDYYIYLVLEAAAIHGDIAFNEYRGKSLRAAGDLERQVSPTLLKSLTPVQDLLIYQYITSNPETPHGELPGIFLMHMLGLRNGEAAGADFGDIRELCSGVFSVFINKTTMRNSNERQFSGKTWNAVRDLPLKKIVKVFLNQRRSFLEREVAAGRIRDQQGQIVQDVDRLPIACRGTNYGTPCSANDLTRVGKQVLMSAKVSDAEFRELDRYVKLGVYDEEGWDDKDPTSYLFRRSYATHLRLLEVPDSTRKYIIGHNTDDQADSRVSYENEDKLNAVHEMLKYHPLNWMFYDDQQWGEMSLETLRTQVEGKGSELPNEVISSDVVYRITGDGKPVVLDIEALQAVGDNQIPIKVVSQSDNAKSIRYRACMTGSNRKADEHMNTSWQNVKVYLTTLNKLVKEGRKLQVRLTKR